MQRDNLLLVVSIVAAIAGAYLVSGVTGDNRLAVGALLATGVVAPAVLTDDYSALPDRS